MADTEWTIRHYDRAGNGISANYSGYSDIGTTNEIAHATDRRLSFGLNNADVLDFSLYLDDPMAAQIHRLTSYVKVWRSVPGYSNPTNQPCFAGIVQWHRKDGASNVMNVRVMSPLWRLQLRFHLLNHYLKTNPDTAALYKQSELIWRLIFFISNAFGPIISHTGIEEGTFYDLANEVVVAPYFQPKGANVWAEIFDGILAKAGSVDIIPRYHHTDGSGTLMYMDTALKRGTDRSGSVAFTYRTASPSNCDNVTEEEFVDPGTFGNYVWAVGAGGPNSGKIAVAQDNSATGLGYGAIGIYMRRDDFPDEKRLGKLVEPSTGKPSHLKANAVNILARALVPNTSYAVEVSPAANIYYDKDFSLGDVITLNATKGALNISGLKQRVHECTLAISDNNMEQAFPLISHDFTGKVAET